MFLHNICVVSKIFFMGSGPFLLPGLILYFFIKRNIGPFEYYCLPVLLVIVSTIISMAMCLTFSGIKVY